MYAYLTEALNLAHYFHASNHIRELPGMMSASEGEGGNGKVDVAREVA